VLYPLSYGASLDPVLPVRAARINARLPLRDVQELSIEETAGLLGLPPATRLHRARRELRCAGRAVGLDPDRSFPVRRQALSGHRGEGAGAPATLALVKRLTVWRTRRLDVASKKARWVLTAALATAFRLRAPRYSRATPILETLAPNHRCLAQAVRRCRICAGARRQPHPRLSAAHPAARWQRPERCSQAPPKAARRGWRGQPPPSCCE
jgi:hypothetical protein